MLKPRDTGSRGSEDGVIHATNISRHILSEEISLATVFPRAQLITMGVRIQHAGSLKAIATSIGGAQMRRDVVGPALTSLSSTNQSVQ